MIKIRTYVLNEHTLSLSLYKDKDTDEMYTHVLEGDRDYYVMQNPEEIIARSIRSNGKLCITLNKKIENIFKKQIGVILFPKFIAITATKDKKEKAPNHYICFQNVDHILNVNDETLLKFNNGRTKLISNTYQHIINLKILSYSVLGYIRMELDNKKL